jgi:isoquinoline 1-oxidoreductase beta subunit
VEEASKLEVPKNPKLKDPKDFRLLGKSVPRPEIPSKINGTAILGLMLKFLACYMQAFNAL